MKYTNWNGANPPKRICSCLKDLTFLCQRNSIKYSLVFLSVIFILLLGHTRTLFFIIPHLLYLSPLTHWCFPTIPVLPSDRDFHLTLLSAAGCVQGCLVDGRGISSDVTQKVGELAFPKTCSVEMECTRSVSSSLNGRSAFKCMRNAGFAFHQHH